MQNALGDSETDFLKSTEGKINQGVNWIYRQLEICSERISIAK